MLGSMPDRPTIILDIDGGELGCEEMLRGVAQGCALQNEAGCHFVLATSEPAEANSLVAKLLGVHQRGRCSVEILEAGDKLPAKISSPVEVYKNFPQSSIRVAMARAKATPQSVVISPGSTGLVMTAAMFTLGRVKGIERAPIGTPLPARGRELFYVDGGSNVDCKPQHLHQFALLAHLYMEIIRGVENPRIAILSNGSESYKGNALVRETFQLLEQDRELNFVGFTEGHTMQSGEIDIMVCDGFLGNILLKSAEGIAEFLVGVLKEQIKKDWYAALAAKIFLKGAFRRFASNMDYAQFGGAPLLGLKGNVIICHGRSTAEAIKNAIIVGSKLAKSDMTNQVEKFISNRVVGG